MTRRIATSAVRLAMTLALSVAGGLALVAVARAAPAPGLYEGHTAAGITVAVTVIGQGPTAQVTDTGAICQSPNPGPESAPPVDGVGADGEYRYRIADNGAFGVVGAGDDQEVAGQINGTSGEVSVSRNSLLMRFCDPADDADHAKGAGYAVPVTRVGAARTDVADGQWRRQDPSGAGTFAVWGGGAFVGQFSLESDLGPSDLVQCSVTPASLQDGTTLDAGGAFSLPWSAEQLGYVPQTPTTGTLAGKSGSWTYRLDSPYILDTALSGCPVPAPVTDPVHFVSATRPGPLVKAPKASPVPLGSTAPTSRCAGGEYRTRAGAFVLCSRIRPRVSGASVTLTGRVTINGFLFVQTDGLHVGLADGRIRSDGKVQFGAIVSGYDLTLGRVALDLRSGHLAPITLPGLASGLKLGGVPVRFGDLGGTAPSVSIDLAQGALTIASEVDFKVAGQGLAFQGNLGVGPHGVTADLTSSGFAIPLTVAGRQLFELKSLDFHYDQAKDAWSIGGAADLSLPGGFAAEATAAGAVSHGRFDSVSLKLDATGDGIPGPFDTYLSGGSFDLSGLAAGLHSATIGLGLDGGWPFKVQRAVGIGFQGTGSFDVADLRLTLGADLTLDVDKTQLASGTATLIMDFDQPLFEADATINVLDIIQGDAHLRIDGEHFVSEGKLSVVFGPSSPPIKFIDEHWPFGWLDDPPSQIGPLASAEAIVSDIGAGARAQVSVWKLKFGATVSEKWGDSLQYDIGFGETRPLTGLAPESERGGPAARAARPRTQAVTVAPGRQALVVSGVGSAAGALTLRDPRGRLVVDTARVPGARTVVDHGRILVGRRGTQGGVIVRSPRPGRWHVSSSGAEPFTAVTATTVAARDAGLARAQISRPRRSIRPGQRLTVRVRLPRGTTVQLRASAARGDGDAGVPLGVVDRARDVVRLPRDYSGRRLTLVAITRRGGVPVGITRARHALAVRHRPLGRPRRLRARRDGHRLIVGFARVAGAARYVVTVEVRGRRYTTVVDRPRVRLRLPTGGVRTVVRVAAVSATTARVGPAARRVLAAGAHPHPSRRPRRRTAATAPGA